MSAKGGYFGRLLNTRGLQRTALVIQHSLRLQLARISAHVLRTERKEGRKMKPLPMCALETSEVWTTGKVLCAVTCMLLMVVGIASAQVLGLGAWQKDPDSAVSLADVVTSTLLPAPDMTLGDLDTMAAGTAGTVVGIDSSIADPPDPPSSGNTFFVDNTPGDGDCPQATFTTIQSAIDVSGPNDTIIVCPGTYQEQLTIVSHNHDGLRIESLNPLAATIKWPTVETPPLALIDFNTADHVTVRYFTISGPFTFPGCSPDRHEGLLVENAFDERITHNHITLIQNSNPLLFGCQEGDAVAIGRRTGVSAGAPGSAIVWLNQIDEYQKNGVQAVNTGTFADVQHNVITASTNPAIHAIIASNGVVVFRMAAATVSHNAISGNKYTPFPLSTGVILDQAPEGSSTVNFNQVFENDFGIETDTQMQLDISHNDVFNSVSDAVTLCGDTTQGCGPAQQIVVRSNNIYSNKGSGILLLGADSNLLKTNQVENNGTAGPDTTDGIRVGMNSGQNQILENHMSGNVTYDCRDFSTGSGTAGTNNTWTNDQGATSNPSGLCH